MEGLIEFLESASGPIEGAKAWDIADRFNAWGSSSVERELFVSALQGSIDAALALAERVLPRWGWDFGKPARMGEHGGQPWADCWPPVEDGEVRAFRLGGPRPTPNHTNAATPALAICAAILRANDHAN